MERKKVLRLNNDKMKFKLVKSIYNTQTVFKEIEEGGNIWIVEKKDDAKWMNESRYELVTTVINSENIKFIENYAKYFKDAKVIIVYPKDASKVAERIEKELERYSKTVMTVLLPNIEEIDL